MPRYTVRQVARHLKISDTSVRMWAREFAEFMTPDANPPKGQQRAYDDSDVAVLGTIAALRSKLVEFDDIRAELANGVRVEPLDAPGAPLETPAGGDMPPRIGEAFMSALTTLENQNNALLAQVSNLHERLLDAERRAAAGEAAASERDRLLERLERLEKRRRFLDFFRRAD
jgi:DNA-binding transcriptional MerR regulator